MAYNEADTLRLIALESSNGLGKKVNEHLKELRNSDYDYVVPVDEVRFSNGEGKIKILETIRDKDVYILSDVGNYSITYKMYDFENHKSPDDHFQDIRRVIYAIRGHSKTNSVIMPLLYESRQHRRKGRESLDCAVALQDLVGLGVKNIITFDAHDVNIQNAIPRDCFESFFPTRAIIETFLNNEDIDLRNMFIIAPDAGAVDRANLYANLFRCNMGFFRKERDTTKIIDGHNPIIKHQYVGESVKGKNVIISDDMIASGESILDVAKEAKSLGAENIYLIATFSMFTNGTEKFDKAYEEKTFNKLYTTNLTYIREEYKNKEWLEEVDCSLKVAKVINNLNQGKSLNKLLNDSNKTSEIIAQRIRK